MPRRKFVCGNWKMHKTVRRGAWRWCGSCGSGSMRADPGGGGAALHRAGQPVKRGAGRRRSIQLSAQNCHQEKQGAFTGEVSAPMLAELGCDGVILGHSERRQYFGETDEGVNRKLRAALEAQLHPIVCVGETLQEREANRTWEVVSRQVRGAFAGMDAMQVGRCTVAYEPVWAIGTGKVATTAQAQEVHGQIRGLLRELASARVADGGAHPVRRVGEAGQRRGPARRSRTSTARWWAAPA